MNILILTDNEFIYENIKMLIQDEQYKRDKFRFFYSPINSNFKLKYKDSSFMELSLKDNLDELIDTYDLIFSLHCKQIFPERLVSSVRCINVHPGYNPYNRGYYPQVYGILNKLPAGVTIHEMDAILDHGPIIVQEQIEINEWDTSYDVYQRIQLKEIELLSLHLRNLIDNNYETFKASEGNLNMKSSFDELSKIDLDKETTFREAIDYFRAMTFKGYNNAHFIDKDGNKVYVEMKLTKDN